MNVLLHKKWIVVYINLKNRFANQAIWYGMLFQYLIYTVYEVQCKWNAIIGIRDKNVSIAAEWLDGEFSREVIVEGVQFILSNGSSYK
jgi:hypothetical protein